MGFDIDIVSVDDDRIVCTHASDYLTGNFGRVTHVAGWYLPVDLHGRSGRVVTERARATLARLREKGFVTGTPDPSNGSWAWGVKGGDGTRMEEREFVGVLMHHLEWFARLGEKYPEQYFIADNGCSYGYYDDEDEYHALKSDEEQDV